MKFEDLNSPSHSAEGEIKSGGSIFLTQNSTFFSAATGDRTHGLATGTFKDPLKPCGGYNSSYSRRFSMKLVSLNSQTHSPEIEIDSGVSIFLTQNPTLVGLEPAPL